jgi:two-component system chemotaxis response regulator CheB
MLVDDSAIIRGFMRRWIEEDGRVDLVKVCADGAQAVAEAAACKPDVIILDIEMPNMDGLTALPQLRRLVPDARIVMASTLTSAGAAQTVKALALGAADYIAKPQTSQIGGVDSYRKDLLDKIVALGERSSGALRPRAEYRLHPRPTIARRPAALVVAASTGGPAALPALLGPIGRNISQPILIVQHMPATFTPLLAEKLEQSIGKPCREAVDGEGIAAGAVLVAPGDQHMRVAKGAAGPIIRLDRSEPVNSCRPAADPLFETAAAAFGGRVLGIVLTGMGMTAAPELAVSSPLADV